MPLRSFWDVWTQPSDVSAGQVARAVFVGANLNNSLRHSDSYPVLERLVDGSWVKHLGDQDVDTRFRWEDKLFSRSVVTLEWTVPSGAAGTYRFVYQGDRRTDLGAIRPITGTSREFRVVRAVSALSR